MTRLSCPGCATDISGHFEGCEFCALDGEDRQLLRLFLGTRGNLKAVERQLGVSYPTARARFEALLSRLGLLAREPRDDSPLELLRALARGELEVEQVQAQLPN